jgi:phenylpropionate dioxygenase-like ring-hydroxylating dioxygenase large terminal subunit
MNLPPHPNGWFRICEADELAPGQVLPKHYMGNDLVLFRTESGRVRVLDAFCPHLGAHLGHGGKMVGENIVCPFHAWKFNGETGELLEVPYAKKMPPKKPCINTWPVCEVNGIVFVWYDSEGRAPSWEIPEVPEINSGEYTDPIKKTFVINAHPQEMAENLVDPAHFKYIHGNDTVPSAEASADGHILNGKIGLTFTTPRGDVEGYVDVKSYGFGFGRTFFSGIVDTLVVITGTVVEEFKQEVCIRFYVKKMGDEGAEQAVAKAFTDEVSKQFLEDKPIWENKTYWEKPQLCDGDGAIAVFRKWAKQFYPAGSVK